MCKNNKITTLFNVEFTGKSYKENPWQGRYKIPWDDHEISRRMLKEHLSQTHDLASRGRNAIKAQAGFVMDRFLPGCMGSVLDLCCGPGLYASHFNERGHQYHGVDFGPASIDYAQAMFSNPNCRFTLGNVVDAHLGGPYDLAVMIYGEFNVFSPVHCREILKRVNCALKPGGGFVAEVHTRDAVKRSGQGGAWHRSTGGLFSDRPHLCLQENYWDDDTGVAKQYFHIVDADTADVETWCSTMQAWSEEDYVGLLEEADFNGVKFHSDWPGASADLMLVSAVKRDENMMSG